MYTHVHTCTHTHISCIHTYGGVNDSEMHAIVDIYKHHFVAFNDGHQFNAFTCVYAERSLI